MYFEFTEERNLVADEESDEKVVRCIVFRNVGNGMELVRNLQITNRTQQTF